MRSRERYFTKKSKMQKIQPTEFCHDDEGVDSVGSTPCLSSARMKNTRVGDPRNHVRVCARKKKLSSQKLRKKKRTPPCDGLRANETLRN